MIHQYDQSVADFLGAQYVGAAIVGHGIDALPTRAFLAKQSLASRHYQAKFGNEVMIIQMVGYTDPTGLRLYVLRELY